MKRRHHGGHVWSYGMVSSGWIKRSKTGALLALVCCLAWATSCSDSSNPIPEQTTEDTGSISEPDTEMLADTNIPDTEPEPDTAEPDTTEPDTAEPDIEEDTTEDVIVTDVPIDPSMEGQTCLQTPECEGEGRSCLEGVCTLVPSSRVYVETNYVLEQPEEISAVVSVLKGFVGDTGFFMTRMEQLGEDDTIGVTYGGGDPVTDGDEEAGILPTFEWQRPDELLEFRMHPYTDPERPLAGEMWESDVFNYKLVALFDFNDVRNEVGFNALNTTVRMEFSEDFSEINRGTIDGFITRQEAVDRWINFGEDCNTSGSLCCIVSVGVCPAFDCVNDEAMSTIADILDCNGAELDADVDPEIPGNDAYHAIIYFESILVELAEPEDEE